MSTKHLYLTWVISQVRSWRGSWSWNEWIKAFKATWVFKRVQGLNGSPFRTQCWNFISTVAMLGIGWLWDSTLGEFKALLQSSWCVGCQSFHQSKTQKEGPCWTLASCLWKLPNSRTTKWQLSFCYKLPSFKQYVIAAQNGGQICQYYLILQNFWCFLNLFIF